MIENRPPRRPGYSRDSSARPYPDDRERMTRARQAAEALFAVKPAAEKQHPIDQSTGKPKVLITPAPAQPATVEAAAVKPEPSITSAIPAAHAARIRTLVKYGMTLAQVAEIYKVPIDEIARIFRKP